MPQELWRNFNDDVQLLLQRRSVAKRVCTYCYDISAARHIDLGERPDDAAKREAEVEKGIKIDLKKFHLIGDHRAYMQVGIDIENEFQSVYGYNISGNIELSLDSVEVLTMLCSEADKIKQEASSNSKRYVPHDKNYFSILFVNPARLK